MKLKKEFRKKSGKAQLETMGRYMSDIASNVIDTIMGEKAGRMDYLEEGSDLMQGVGDISTWRADTSRDESIIESVEDLYADVGVRGNRKWNKKKESNSYKNLCPECKKGFNSRSRKVKCKSCMSQAHGWHFGMNDNE